MDRILVALDGSPRAPGVLATAASLAERLGAKLWLFRAVGVPLEVPSEVYSMAPDSVAGLLQERGMADLRQLAAGVKPELVAGVRVALGAPWQAICEAARAYGASLVVVGSHGYGGLDRVLGTTAAKVVNHADRSVLVVRAPELL